jgi:hypothetical protein
MPETAKQPQTVEDATFAARMEVNHWWDDQTDYSRAIHGLAKALDAIELLENRVKYLEAELKRLPHTTIASSFVPGVVKDSLTTVSAVPSPR